MIAYIIRRILTALLIVWAVATICFIILQLAPGDPASMYIRPEIKPAVVENIRKQLGFDLPIWQQYIKWLRGLSAGNFGTSFIHKQPVIDIIANTLPNTLRLTLVVFCVQFLMGIVIGIYLATKQGSKIEQTVNGFLLFLYSMPGFWLALILILIFSLHLGWLPSSQMQSMRDINGFIPILWDQVKHLILPVTVLSIPFITYTTRFIQDQLRDVFAQPYFLAAKTYGFSGQKILFKYALKNALLPLITLIGLYLPFILGGAVITEYIFAWPGMGRITVTAIFAHDFPLILASTIIAALAVVIGNLLSDILYALADPRIRTKETL
ncbi:MAG: ABC transporter permease subunit [Caldithrix sp.]|nr:ABC transporter permease subunit [Caldithrix sp.]